MADVARATGWVGATRQQPLAAVLVSVGVLAVAGYAVLPERIWQDVAYVVVGLVGVGGILLGVRRNRPLLTRPWYLMAAGQLLWVVGDAVYSWFEDVAGIDPFPSVADALYLAAYPVIAVGLQLLIRGRLPQRDWAGLLDSATVTAGLGLLSWVVLARPTIATSEDSVLAAGVAVAYPIGDILLIGGLIRLLTTPAGRSAAMGLLLGAIALLVVADTAYLALTLFGSGESYPLDYLWMGSYLLWAAAAMHPSMAELSRPTTEVDVAFRRGRLVALALATLVAPGILAVELITGRGLDAWAVVVGSVVMFLLVVARMRVAIDQVAAVTAQRTALADEVAFHVNRDSLTRLVTSGHLLQLLQGAMARAERQGETLALLFLDLDGFKVVNDTHGHRCGDDVLRTVARRLTHSVRAEDTAARLGGDEFLVLLEAIEDKEVAVRVAERLIRAVGEPIPVGGGLEVTLGASIGITYRPGGPLLADAFLHEADAALYRAKAHGRGRVEVFTPALRDELATRADLEAAIAHAVEHDELVLRFQPIVEVGSERTSGYEALVRWDRPGHGMVPPLDFIPVAESSDLICEVDTWVLHHAVDQLARWNEADGSANRALTVNISGRHVNQARILDDVAAVLAVHAIDPGQLILEITETVLVQEATGLANLHRLRELGVAIALDDYGAGYSSIATLARLPLDLVKIDRSFLDTSSPARVTLLQLMVHAAHAFGLPVIVEGVENAEQLALLKAIDVEAAQGFFLGRPMTVEELDQHLTRHPPTDPVVESPLRRR